MFFNILFVVREMFERFSVCVGTFSTGIPVSLITGQGEPVPRDNELRKPRKVLWLVLVPLFGFWSGGGGWECAKKDRLRRLGGGDGVRVWR
jgi:hypothetical protein